MASGREEIRKPHPTPFSSPEQADVLLFTKEACSAICFKGDSVSSKQKCTVTHKLSLLSNIFRETSMSKASNDKAFSMSTADNAI